MDTNQHEFRLPKKRRGAEGTEFRKVEATFALLCGLCASALSCLAAFTPGHSS